MLKLDKLDKEKGSKLYLEQKQAERAFNQAAGIYFQARDQSTEAYRSLQAKKIEFDQYLQHINKKYGLKDRIVNISFDTGEITLRDEKGVEKVDLPPLPKMPQVPDGKKDEPPERDNGK